MPNFLFKYIFDIWFVSTFCFASLVQLRFFCTSQPWRKASSQSSETSSSFSVGFLRSPFFSARIEIFPGLYNFPGAHANLVVTSLANVLHVDTTSVQHAAHATYVALPLRKYLRSNYFREQVSILLCHPRNLYGMSRDLSGKYLTHICIYI